MTFASDSILDAALQYIIDNATHLYLCSAEPSTYTEAATTYALGSKASPTVGSLANRTGGGRQITISAITDGSVSGTGAATHWALVDSVGTELLVAKALNASQNVTSGNQFKTDAVTVGIPDAV